MWFRSTFSRVGHLPGDRLVSACVPQVKPFALLCPKDVRHKIAHTAR